MYIMKEPEYWRIDDAVKKVIAKHTYLFNCERIMKEAKKCNNPWMVPYYIAQASIEGGKFAAAIRASSRPKRIIEIKSPADQLMTAKEFSDAVNAFVSP